MPTPTYRLFEGEGDGDVVIGSLMNDDIYGTDGNDVLGGLTGRDVLFGYDGDDVLDGGVGDDQMFGGGGSDVLIATEGNDDVFGGDGKDRYVVNGTAGDWVFINDTGGRDLIDVRGGITGAYIDLTPGAVSSVDGRDIEISGLSEEDTGLELVLSQDLSGSFSDDVPVVQDLAPDLVAALAAEVSELDVGLTSFIDKPVSPHGSTSDHEFESVLSLTTDVDAFFGALDGLVLGSGADGPEAQMTALLQTAIRSVTGWTESATKVLVLTTDAIAHEEGDLIDSPPNNGDDILDGTPPGTGEDYPNREMVRDALASEGIIPIFAIADFSGPDGSTFGYYEDLVDFFGFGSVVELSSDSSDLVDAILDGIGSAVDTRIEDVLGTHFDDVIMGNDAKNELKGKGGNDNIYGGDNDDTIIGGAGKDKVWGDDGDDIFVINAGGVSQKKDTIVKDFEDGSDLIDMSDTGLGFSDLDISGGAKTKISTDGGPVFLILEGVSPGDITADDFIF